MIKIIQAAQNLKKIILWITWKLSNQIQLAEIGILVDQSIDFWVDWKLVFDQNWFQSIGFPLRWAHIENRYKSNEIVLKE